MKLTSGQKKALVNKVMEILDSKNAERIKELRNNWKPNKKVQEILNKLKEVIKARDKYLALAKEAGMEIDYYGIVCKSFSADLRYSIRNDDTGDVYANLYDSIRDQVLGDKLINSMPGRDQVENDIELLSIGKDFDVEAFLDKYRNL